MSDDVTARFFHWMNAHNITRPQAAELLGVDERSLSTYRGRGLPKKQKARAEQVMLEKSSPLPPARDENRISVTFTDEQYAIVEKAAGIVECLTKEFVRKAACDEAKRHIKEDEEKRMAEEEKRIQDFPPLGKVADDGLNTQPMPQQNPDTNYRQGNA